MTSSSADTKTRKVSKRTGKKLDVDQVLGQVVQLLLKHKPSEITISKISKVAGVPRPTLYYYFGKSLQSILDEAAKYAMKRMVVMYQHADLDLIAPTWHDYQKTRLRKVVSLVIKYPWIPGLYLRYREAVGDHGDTIRRTEEEYVQFIARAWKHYHKDAADPLAVRVTGYLKLGLLMGLAIDFQVWSSSPETLDQLIEDLTATVTEYMRKVYGPLKRP